MAHAERPWAPATNHDQSCAFCGAARPTNVHRLDPAHVHFNIYAKPHTLPTFWAACAPCEALVGAGNDRALLRLMSRDSDGVAPQAALAAFRAADLGGEPLPEGPPDTIRP
jgi:hypothetical protein